MINYQDEAEEYKNSNPQPKNSVYADGWLYGIDCFATYLTTKFGGERKKIRELGLLPRPTSWGCITPRGFNVLANKINELIKARNND